ncbi:LacI family DNA-binding transcriptional regulator [Frisingicoccus sp.]|uniref:LacI family DNA-binding transcriptional regulator n=1 Tax=Frisingicoccus sp. TaxID=1918627 RepID=UPI003AB8B55F
MTSDENVPKKDGEKGGLPENMVTLKDLEAASGISKSTISRVINNDPNVKQETRDRVLEYVHKMNYKPNVVARSMITGSLPLVLIIVGDIQSDYFARTVVGVEKVLSAKGYMPVVYNSMYNVENEKKFISMAKNFKFAGLIPMTAFNTEQLEDVLKDVTCPTVLINRDIRRMQLDEVIGDDFESGYLATKHLIDNGHRKIVHVSGNLQSSTVNRKREKGYRTALEDHGIPVDESLIFRGELDLKSGYKLAEKIFSISGVTGICSNNFLMGIGIIRYGRTIGKHLLKEYDLACCECVPELYEKERIAYAGPDLEAMGQKAAEFLIKRIENSDEPRQKVYFSATKVYNPRHSK